MLTLSLSKLRQNTKTTLKPNELFIQEDTHYSINSFLKNVLKIAAPSLGCELYI